jgi:murein DD-endopeptidase MepM/ murein hydrolase activator NlpD
MPRINVSSRSRASSHIWPHVAVLALIGVAAAGCSDSARFDSNPYASNGQASPPQQVVGSVTSRPATSSHVEAQPLPAPSQPTTVASTTGVQSVGAYRVSTPNYSDATSSVRHHQASASPKPAGDWTWDGGSPLTVGYGETVETIARKHGVPLAAMLQTNGISNPASVKPGQRLVIPRRIAASAPAVAHSSVAPVPKFATASEKAYVVQPGENLSGIAHRHGVTLAALAKANKLQPYAKVSMGDRLTIPGGHQVAARQTPAPTVAPPRAAPLEKVASLPTQSVRMATQEPAATETVVKSAEAAGSMPSFRWPVRGHVIAGFGPKTNGGQNDGINLAVPEGTPIKAADDGVVAYSGHELKGYGNLILIRHANGFVSAYAHASELLVKRGDTIKRGQVIAHAGQTGSVTSPQLHFEIRKGSTPVDPTKYLGGA